MHPQLSTGAPSLSEALTITEMPALPAGMTVDDAWARLCVAVLLIKQHNSIAESFGRHEIVIPAEQFADIEVGA